MDFFNNLKNPVLVSALFYVISSDWFENWLGDLFPQLRTNRTGLTIVKTILFGLFFWLGNIMLKKFQENSKNSNSSSSSSNGATVAKT